jgi:hypothetical protein
VSRRQRIWFVIAAVFAVLNVGGALIAVRDREGGHAMVHLALAAVGGIVAWRIRVRNREWVTAGDGLDARLVRLQQSVDAIAIEVERIGEAQRFASKLAGERLAMPHRDVPSSERDAGES